MMETLHEILEQWDFEEPVHIEKVNNSGAAIASDIWNVTDTYSLKKGDNFEGLKHHIEVSRALLSKGITASCPLVTKGGQDFLDFGSCYYVVTERVMDNFLVLRSTEAAKKEYYIEQYIKEAIQFQKALKADDSFRTVVLDWICNSLENLFIKMNYPYQQDDIVKIISVLKDKQEIHWGKAIQNMPKPCFVCGTQIDEDDISMIYNKTEQNDCEAGFIAVLAIFIVWSSGNPKFIEIIKSNCDLLLYLTENMYL